MNYNNSVISESASNVSFDSSDVNYPSYGRYLEDFELNAIFEHPRGITLTSGFLYDFAMTFYEANPIYINQEYAALWGHPSTPASPLLILNIILSLGVQNNSEKAYANLGYYHVNFLKSVYAGDTLRAFSKIVDKKERGEGKPGIITLHTIGLNQHNQCVIQYNRKIMVLPRPTSSSPQEKTLLKQASIDTSLFTNTQDNIELQIPDYTMDKIHHHLTGLNTYYENFPIGKTIATHNGRTLSDEHFAWTYKLGNTHPLHFDKIFTEGLSGSMSGTPIIYGGLIFAWLLGLASRDISENAIWDLGYTEGYHTQPAKTGDTIYVIHRVIGESDIDSTLKAGEKQFQVIGLKNITPKMAIEKYGAELFIKENNKKKLEKVKIPEKIFEIERKLLIRSNG